MSGVFTARFIAGAVILGVSAVGLRPALAGLSRYFEKSPIELKQKLDRLTADDLPRFRDARAGHGLRMSPGDVETDDVIIQFYIEDDAGAEYQKDELMLFVTYYSDPRDRIAHTPEVCYRQGGAVIADMRTMKLDMPAVGEEPVEVRFLSIEQGASKSILLYVFSCNGTFFNDRESVRLAIGWPGDKYVYFSKIEVVTRHYSDEAQAIERCRKLMEDALSVLVREHLPSKDEVEGSLRSRE